MINISSLCLAAEAEESAINPRFSYSSSFPHGQILVEEWSVKCSTRNMCDSGLGRPVWLTGDPQSLLSCRHREPGHNICVLVADWLAGSRLTAQTPVTSNSYSSARKVESSRCKYSEAAGPCPSLRQCAAASSLPLNTN